MSEETPRLTLQEFAKAIDRSEQSIRNWVKEGLPYERIDGRMRFDLDESIEWLAERDRKRGTKGGRQPANPQREAEEAAPGGKDTVELRKIIAQTRLLELKASQLEGRLVPQELPAKAVAAQAYAIRQQALALPKRFAHQLVGKDDVAAIEEILRTAVDDMLTVLADTDLEQISLELQGNDGDDDTTGD